MDATSLHTRDGRAAFAEAVAREAVGRTGARSPVRPTRRQRKLIADHALLLRVAEPSNAHAIVAGAVEALFGWPALQGSVTDAQGRVIRANSHHWNVLPDGAWLDHEADALGHPEMLRVVAPGHADHGTHRLGFTDRWGPWCQDFAKRFPAFVDPTWGLCDAQAQRNAEQRFGVNWHLAGLEAERDLHLWRQALCGALAEGDRDKRVYTHLRGFPDTLLLAEGGLAAWYRASGCVGVAERGWGMLAQTPDGVSARPLGDPAVERWCAQMRDATVALQDLAPHLLTVEAAARWDNRGRRTQAVCRSSRDLTLWLCLAIAQRHEPHALKPALVG